MFIDLPNNTKALWSRLDEAIKAIPEEDKDVFLLDLMQFCAQWQFTYLSMQYMDETEEPHGVRSPSVESSNGAARSQSQSKPTLWYD